MSQLPFNASLVRNITHNATTQPGLDYFLNGGLNATDANGVPTITAGYPILPGSVILNAAITTPSGYLLCDGGEYSQTDFPTLYKAIGVQFGSSNAVTFFKVPNLSPPAANVDYIIKF